MASRKSSSSVDGSVGGGVRLDLLSIDDHAERSGRSKSNPSTSKIAHATLATTPTLVKFEIGRTPTGDVFISPPKALSGTYLPKNRSVTTAGETQGTTLDTPPQGVGIRSRSSNLASRHQVAGVDAQGVYPPTACVFVANLPEPKDDAALEAAVTKIFSTFGIVFVKIRRDAKNMPFAFCQFTKDEDAKDAMENGKGAMILGRPCRTEMVKANRTFLLYKSDGSDVTIIEAQDLMGQYGPMAKCEFLHHQLQEALRVPRAIVVEYAMFDPSRDLQAAFRHHTIYRVQPYDLKKNVTTTRQSSDEVYLARYETDRRSVYVGNISPTMNESDLKAMFGTIGPVVNMQFIRRQTDDAAPRIFAFVEFSEANMPDEAIDKFDQIAVRGQTLRVQRKVSKNQTPIARRTRGRNYGSPTHGGPSTSPYTPSSVGEARAPNWGWVAAPQVSPYGTQTVAAPQTPGTMYPSGQYYQPTYWPTMPGMGYQQEYVMPSMGYYPAYTSPLYQVQQSGDNDSNTPTRHGHSGSADPSQPGERSNDDA